MTYDLVEIVWRDAAADAGWREPGTKHVAPKIRTVGWLVHHDKHCATVATSVCPDGHYNGTMTIPAGMILKSKKLR